MTAIPKPAHVPPERVIDVNIFDLPGGTEDAQLAWKGLGRNHQLLWTPHHGGHWIATSGDLIERIYRTSEVFSNREVGIPPKKFLVEMLPIQRDGASHKAFRALIDPALRPAAVQQYGVLARDLAIRIIEELQPKGACEFVTDFSLVMPLSIFLSIVNLPVDDREELHALARASSRSPTAQQRQTAFQQILDYLERWIAKRRAEPGDDLLSTIIHSQIDGRPLTHAEVLGMSTLLMFAGLDTVASMMAFVMRYLADHPGHRRWIIENPQQISYAVEELMRRHGVANNVRTATQDVELDGVLLRAGDLIVVPNCLHGLDEQQFAHAGDVDFTRVPKANGTFGWGPHRCAGANLARMEMRILLEEWLKRIPDFEVDHTKSVVQQTGTVNGVLQLPLCWAA
ncbi:cytochrome P450 [Nitrospirillum sp. BR 11164]|uniref:cytochrome P450 n=1 Tax=Nitrospirillum sp. BR 11164 TaxID=3104324 RepID=UPI002AFE141F|nr:cytochrome P450 [Nitrospirillum sp. BR 11164]MEA1652891.1 cytochrome P450 [Nitrospirillum sp. BR 11164]